ncbi:MAG: hypothetical protein VX733_13235 [Candidatus Latescibacterota bacterium]|nr:hypothetical protein [Candidatus Latescibacterota bacterium]
MRTLHVILLASGLGLAACGNLDRDNPMDPTVSSGLQLRDQLIGSWSRGDGEKNEIYSFKIDGSVELRDFTSPSGDTVDRNATFPTTRVRVFDGTYNLVGNLLTVFFTRAQSNDPNDDLQAPISRTVVEISVNRNTLIFTDTDGSNKRFYTPL